MKSKLFSRIKKLSAVEFWSGSQKSEVKQYCKRASFTHRRNIGFYIYCSFILKLTFLQPVTCYSNYAVEIYNNLKSRFEKE
jgi:hypothetical protein